MHMTRFLIYPHESLRWNQSVQLRHNNSRNKAVRNVRLIADVEDECIDRLTLVINVWLHRACFKVGRWNYVFNGNACLSDLFQSS